MSFMMSSVSSLTFGETLSEEILDLVESGMALDRLAELAQVLECIAFASTEREDRRPEFTQLVLNKVGCGDAFCDFTLREDFDAWPHQGIVMITLGENPTIRGAKALRILKLSKDGTQIGTFISGMRRGNILSGKPDNLDSYSLSLLKQGMVLIKLAQTYGQEGAQITPAAHAFLAEIAEHLHNYSEITRQVSQVVAEVFGVLGEGGGGG